MLPDHVSRPFGIEQTGIAPLLADQVFKDDCILFAMTLFQRVQSSYIIRDFHECRFNVGPPSSMLAQR